MSLPESVVELLQLKLTPEEYSTHLLIGGFLTSLEFMNALVQIEAHFDIHFTNEEIAFGSIYTVDQICSLIQAKITNV